MGNKNSGSKKIAFIPTPEQIEKETKKIREEWRTNQDKWRWRGPDILKPRAITAHKLHIDINE